MNPKLESIVHGAIAGVVAAGSMTVLRMMARRAGLIDTMMPQAVEQWARARSGVEADNPAAYSVADQLLHLGYGLAWGAAYGATLAEREPPLKGAAMLAVAQWVVGPMGLLPLLKIAPPPWRAGASELTINVVAHALYAAATAYVTDEFTRQVRDPRRQVPHLRLVSKVG